MDRGAWWATAHGVAKNQTQVSNEHFHSEACGNGQEDSTEDLCNRGGQVPLPAEQTDGWGFTAKEQSGRRPGLDMVGLGFLSANVGALRLTRQDSG